MSVHTSKDGLVHITLTHDQMEMLVSLLGFVFGLVDISKKQDWPNLEAVVKEIFEVEPA